MQKLYASLAIVVMIGFALAAHTWADSESHSAVSIGGSAPDFTLQDQNGKNVSLHDFSGKVIVLEWTNPQCPFVQRHYAAKTMTTLADQYKDNVVWLAINSTGSATNDADKDWVASQSISYPVLNDSAGTVGKAYHATNTPDMFIIGTDGKVLYKGAIDNDPRGDKSDKVNYVHQALDEILAGKPVSTPETKPYGCGVHYKD